MTTEPAQPELDLFVGASRLSRLTATGVLVLAPLLAFNALSTPGVVTVALVLPLMVMVPDFLRVSARSFPAWETLLVAMLALSVMWGVVPNYSAEQLRTYLPLLVTTIVAAAVLPRGQVLQALEISLVLSVLSAACVAIATGQLGQWTTLGLSGQYPKNTFGGILCLAAVVVVARRPRRWPVLLLGIVVLVAMNRSVTAYVTSFVLVLSVLVAQVVLRRYDPRPARVLLLALGVGMVSSAALASRLLSDPAVLAVVGKDPTLSARTAIWQVCWDWIQRSPLLGYGDSGFLDYPSPSPVTGAVVSQFTRSYIPQHPHNGVLDLWGQLGILGIAVFAGLVATRMRSAFTLTVRNDTAALVALGGLVFILFFSLTEPTFLNGWLVYTVVLASLGRPRHHETFPASVARGGGRQPHPRRAPDALPAGSP